MIKIKKNDKTIVCLKNLNTHHYIKRFPVKGFIFDTDKLNHRISFAEMYFDLHRQTEL